jgi:hypothetical protein
MRLTIGLLFAGGTGFFQTITNFVAVDRMSPTLQIEIFLISHRLTLADRFGCDCDHGWLCSGPEFQPRRKRRQIADAVPQRLSSADFVDWSNLMSTYSAFE